MKAALGRPRWQYAIAGAGLGLGAPLGAQILRAWTDVAPSADLREHAFFYGYMLIASCVVFAVFGFFTGVRAERHVRAEEFFRQLSEHDGLTGLLNSRAFSDRCDRAIEKAAKNGESVGLLVIDVDHLKAINDVYGHQRGNLVLQHVADAIRASKRASDEAARWGGDEFAILLRGGDETSARRIAASINEWLSSTPLPSSSVHVTVTTGIAIGAARSAQLFDAADEALYRGKREGGSRVAVALQSHNRIEVKPPAAM